VCRLDRWRDPADRDAVGLEGEVQGVETDSRFDFAPKAGGGDCPDLVQGRGVDDDAALGCDRTAGERGSRAAQNDWNTESARARHERDKLLRVGRDNNGVRGYDL
jgi:hypothetical protein